MSANPERDMLGLALAAAELGLIVNDLQREIGRLRQQIQDREGEDARLRIVLGKLSPRLPENEQERLAAMLRGEVPLEEPLEVSQNGHVAVMDGEADAR